MAVVGSLLLPFPAAYVVARLFAFSPRESVAIAIALVPSSTNVALLILGKAGLATTPTGQTILAATFFDDAIALVALGELRALQRPSLRSFLEPIVGFGFTCLFGAVSLFLTPRIMRRLFPLLPPRLAARASLLGLAGVCLALMCALEAMESSYLLGAFLGGLSFSSLPSMLHLWQAQIKRVQSFLLRIFFSATIGFEIPLRAWAHPRVLALAAALLLPTLLGKAATGALAPPHPSWRDRALIAFSMTTLGELSFVAAVVGHQELGETGERAFAALTLAIAASNVCGPAALRATLAFYERSERAGAAGEEGGVGMGGGGEGGVEADSADAVLAAAAAEDGAEDGEQRS